MAKSETLSATRQKFEEWEKCSILRTRRGSNAPYNSIFTECEWRAWQAGRLQGLEEAAKIRSVMLEALKAILKEFEDHDLGGDCWIRAKSAVELAEAATEEEMLEITRKAVE